MICKWIDPCLWKSQLEHKGYDVKYDIAWTEHAFKRHLQSGGKTLVQVETT